jgi:hypothetical protein
MLGKKKTTAPRGQWGLLKTHLTRFAIWALPEPCRGLFRVCGRSRGEKRAAGDDEPKSWRVVPRYERTRLPSNDYERVAWIMNYGGATENERVGSRAGSLGRHGTDGQSERRGREDRK